MASETGALHIFGVTLIGATPENGRRLLLTGAFIIVVIAAGRGARWIVSRVTHTLKDRRAAFWSRQVVNIGTALLLMLGVVSVWFDDPTRLATAFTPSVSSRPA